MDVPFPQTMKCIVKLKGAVGIHRHQIRATALVCEPALVYKFNLPVASELGNHVIAFKAGQIGQALQFNLAVSITFNAGRPR